VRHSGDVCGEDHLDGREDVWVGFDARSSVFMQVPTYSSSIRSQKGKRKRERKDGDLFQSLWMPGAPD
jgi:hypothetical protein